MIIHTTCEHCGNITGSVIVAEQTGTLRATQYRLLVANRHYYTAYAIDPTPEREQRIIDFIINKFGGIKIRGWENPKLVIYKDGKIL